MARDYEDVHGTDDLSDRELREVVQEALADNDGVDHDNVTVVVKAGVVRLTGRVGTDEEARVAEHVVTDVLGIADVRNELVVDALRRSEEPDGADDTAAEQAEREGILGDAPDQQTDTAENLGDHLEEDMFGTRDMHEAIETGESYSPPDAPTPEGRPGTAGEPGRYGEDH
jgi:hypothetical protein